MKHLFLDTLNIYIYIQVKSTAADMYLSNLKQKSYKHIYIYHENITISKLPSSVIFVEQFVHFGLLGHWIKKSKTT